MSVVRSKVGRHWSRWPVAAAVALAAVAIGGCGAAGSSASVTLKMTTVGSDPGLSQVISRFEKLHPNIAVNVTAIPSDTYQPTVLSELAGGNGPDVMAVWGGSGNAMGVGQLARANKLAKLNGAHWISEIPPAVEKLYMYKGDVYAVTQDVVIAAFYYNKKVFAAAHLSVPQTFPELLASCATLRKNGVIPMDLGNQAVYLNSQIPIEFANDIVYAQDPNFGTEILSGKMSFATSNLWRQAVLTGNEEYAKLFSHHCVQPDSTATTETEAIAAVASGKAAMVNLFAQGARLYIDNPHGSFGTFEAPALNTPGKVFVTEDPNNSYAVNAHSQHQTEAREFISYLATPANIVHLSKVDEAIPDVTPKGYALPSLYDGIASLLKDGKTAQYPATYWSNYNTKLTWEAQGQLIATGSTSPSAATDAIMKTFS